MKDNDIVVLVADTMQRIFAVTPMTSWDSQVLYKEVWRSTTGFFVDKSSITMSDMVESFLRVIRMKKVDELPELPDPNPEYLPTKKLERWHELKKS